jgi:hypothetical protein
MYINKELEKVKTFLLGNRKTERQGFKYIVLFHQENHRFYQGLFQRL